MIKRGNGNYKFFVSFIDLCDQRQTYTEPTDTEIQTIFK
jgi:hypothetical protein